MELGTRRSFAVVVLLGVAGTGSVVYFLNAVGLGTLGSVVWFLGYGTMVYTLWYGWIRPLDLTGGTDPDEIADATTDEESADPE
jgi:hypothetical protein